MDEKNTVSFAEVLEKNGVLCWTNVGKSMMPLLREGKDVMVIKKTDTFKKYDAVLYLRDDGEYILHRILKKNKDGTYWIIGDNCSTGENVRQEQILGTMEQVIRNGKTISSGDFNYRVYVHLWCDCLALRFFYFRCRALNKKIKKRLKRLKK